MARRNPFMASAAAWSSLGLDASAVIGLRLAKIAAGGPAAAVEAQRMVTEKALAAVEAQWAIGLAVATGKGRGAGHKTLALYRRKVKANRRRLSRSA